MSLSALTHVTVKINLRRKRLAFALARTCERLGWLVGKDRARRWGLRVLARFLQIETIACGRSQIHRLEYTEAPE